MRVVLQGSLHHFGVRDLLAFVARSPHAGTFDAEAGGARVRLALRAGQVIGAESDGASDPIDAVATLLQWSQGTFTFLDDVVLAEGATPLALDLVTLIADAETRIAEMRRVLELFPHDSVRFRVVNRPPGEINITAEEFQVLFQIGSGKSLAKLRTDSGRDAADLFPIVKRLQMTGLIEEVADPDATDPRAAASLRPAPPAAPVASAAPPVPASPAAPAPKPAPDVSAPSPAPAKESARAKESGQATERGVAPAPLPAAQTPAIEPGGPTVKSVETPLVATLTADNGIMHPLLEETSTIGRTASNAIALRDTSVSAKHARVVRTADGFTIEDLGSRNGTFVNSEKLSGTRLLAEGDVVRFGKIILTFNLASDVQKGQSTEREMLK